MFDDKKIEELEGKKKLDLAKVDSDANPDEKDDEGSPNFIRKDGEAKTSAQKRDEVFGNLEELLRTAISKLEGVRPEGNRQRNLDRETGGLEANKDGAVSSADAWDKRPDEINQMIQDARDLNNATESSRERSFIHDKKRHEIHKKRIDREKEGTSAHLSYAQKIDRFRKAEVDNSQERALSGDDAGRGA